MLKARVVPVLLLKEGRMIKTRQFKFYKDTGDPMLTVRVYDAQGADELAILDISASVEGRNQWLGIISQSAKECFIGVAFCVLLILCILQRELITFILFYVLPFGLFSLKATAAVRCAWMPSRQTASSESFSCTACCLSRPVCRALSRGRISANGTADQCTSGKPSSCAFICA